MSTTQTSERADAKVSFKLFHNDRGTPLGRMSVTITRKDGGHVVRLGGLVESVPGAIESIPEVVLFQMRKVVKGHIKEWLKDRQFCVLYNEDACIETVVSES